MKKQIECIHYKKDFKKGRYSYNLIKSELNLCKKCEKKLRKEILKQIKFEEELNEK